MAKTEYTSHIHLMSLNSICPYSTMYPLNFPLSYLRTHDGLGVGSLIPSVVAAGSPSAPRLRGIPSVGVHTSPIAVGDFEDKTGNDHAARRRCLSGWDPC